MQYLDRNSELRRLVIPSLVLISSSVIVNLPGAVWAGDASGPAGTPAPTTQAAPSATVGGVAGLIAHLHEELKITPAQESSFKRLAEVMRENAETMSTLAKKRAESRKTMTAVDDLKSYSEISEAHAQGIRKMIPAFQALYDTMSDAQKKAADEEFREHYASHHHRKPS